MHERLSRAAGGGCAVVCGRYHLQQNPVDDAYSETGRKGRKGGKAVATREGGGKVQQQQHQQQEPHYLELKWPPEVHLATRDCTCDFWDKVGGLSKAGRCTWFTALMGAVCVSRCAAADRLQILRSWAGQRRLVVRGPLCIPLR